ncbi:MAG TPA: large conductance mechanosensitive channel protein MscL [Desulfosporosinus sp.]|nr:large conductance mechanosensitive channel protein MscL [Desulfosporosinus sp.]
MMSFVKEFKEFATRGNVVDLAVGIIIGGAFGKIVSSFVADIIMPPIGLILGGIRFTDIRLGLKDAVVDGSGKVVQEAITLNIGNFIQTTFDFLIIAAAIFALVRIMNSLNRKKKKEEAAVPPTPSVEVQLLTEIRDLLKKQP